MNSIEPPLNCLLVDDLDENLVALEALLADEGVTFLKARSGEQALELLLSHDVALALLDVQMPEMDGFELAEFMRGSERTRHVPIIFLTAGNADLQRRFRGYEAGAVDFIQKPIEADILRSKARIFFDLYRQRQQIAMQRDELAVLTATLRVTDRRKNEFLAVLAHELRNPVMALGAGLQLMERRPDTGTVNMIRGEMGKYVAHLSRLIEDLLDLGRIDQGKISLKPERLILQEVLQFAIAGTQHHFEASQHRLELDIPQAPIWLEGDGARLAQIVGNLLTNAAKYTPPGGEVRLSARLDDFTVVIEVADTGAGIPSEMQTKIFDLFAQVEGASDRTHEGLGIGLALAKQLVELHGGTIALKESIEGEGSTFAVFLPERNGCPLSASS
ncbi:hybrid sensor histidine kinase/response regulator (plasmid) [Novosphingobium sp. BL-8A]|uniref:hybrid sensor histidine kinase/response regulator n=1 Tax=Novosphingobium sp. BL-8A TaxID=3127639 RepID=UPI0037569529